MPVVKKCIFKKNRTQTSFSECITNTSEFKRQAKISLNKSLLANLTMRPSANHHGKFPLKHWETAFIDLHHHSGLGFETELTHG